MIEIQDMRDAEAVEFLSQNHFGHLGLADGDDPYVVPVHFAFESGKLYIFTTLGLKAEILERNPKVCLQSENALDNENWKSVIVRGTASRITDQTAIAEARELIRRSNPRLTPALSVRWMDHWVRENVEVIYAIEPSVITGRKTKPKVR